MALGLFACRHAAAATDAGEWTPVLRLGGCRSLASVARLTGRTPARSRRKSFRQAKSKYASAADGGSKSESDSLLYSSTTDSDLPSEGETTCGYASKRARHTSPAQAENSGRQDVSDYACCRRERSNIRHQSKLPFFGVWNRPDEDIIRCRFSPNGCYLATCTSGGALRVYETETGQQICNISYAHAAGINDICWHHSSSYIFTASSDGSAALFPLTFRATAGASRRLLRDSGGLATSVRLRVESAVAPVMNFYPQSAAAALVSSASNLGSARGSQTAGRGGSTLLGAGAGGRHSSKHFNHSSSSWGFAAAAAPVTSVTAPQRTASSSSVHCLYTGSYDEFVRSWDMRASRGPLVQVRAHDGPVTSLDFIEASPLLLPPYIPSRSASCVCSDGATGLATLHSDSRRCCCCCRSACCCAPQSMCCCSCGSCCCNVSLTEYREKGRGEAVHFGSTAAAVATALENERNASTFPCGPVAAAALSLPDMLASASVDGLVRLWQAPALKLLRTTRGGRGGWEGGSSGATAASPASAAAAVNSGNGVGCESPAGAAAVATAGCCHVSWSRSGNFLLCLYEQGLGGGTVLRLRAPLQQPQYYRQRQQRQQRQLQEEQGRTCKGTGGQMPQTPEDFEEDTAEEEEKWWGRETCMPLPSPFIWDETVQQELVQSACTTSWHHAPCSRRRPSCNCPTEEQRKTAAEVKGSNSTCGNHGTDSVRAPEMQCERMEICGSCKGSKSHAAVAGMMAERNGAGERAVNAGFAVCDYLAETPQSVLHALLCRKERIFSPYGVFWRDCAVLPGSDGCVRIFDALRGKLLHTLVPAADICSSSSAVCTSVDAHPDWSIGVLATSCSAPDGAVVLWLWEQDDF